MPEARLTIARPDDWHVHFRDGPVLSDVVPHTARQFGRAIVMPNLAPPVRTVEACLAYRDRVLAAVPEGVDFEPLMTLYLHDAMPADEIRRARDGGAAHAVKLYPAGATTHSDAGVTDVRRVDTVLDAMADAGMPLLVHGEVVDANVDVFDRERVFIERVLAPLAGRHPGLKIVFEHITTAEAVDFVEAASDNVAATITAHHLLLNRNAIFEGGLRPHHYCLPVLKRERHRAALVRAATAGSARFFLGTDSAPHPRGAKESDCGCAGVFSAPAALELYTEAFDAAGALDWFETFASLAGPAFYGLAPSTSRVTLVRRPRVVPGSLALAGETVVPFRAGDEVAWTLED